MSHQFHLKKNFADQDLSNQNFGDTDFSTSIGFEMIEFLANGALYDANTQFSPGLQSREELISALKQSLAVLKAKRKLVKASLSLKI